MNASSGLFKKSGYLSLKDYIEDIESMKRNGPWKLPLGISDRIQFFFLKTIVKVLWFSDLLYISYPHEWSPSYSILSAYLRKRGFVDEITELNSNFKGYSFFSFQKNISINESHKPLIGFGVDQDPSTAFSKGMGEIIERLVSGLFNRNENILIASPDDLGKKFPILYPPKYHRFLDVQREHYRELQYHPSDPTDWMRGMNLVTKERTYIPRHIVSWFGFAEARTFKNILLHPTSNGCAGYFTKTGAVLRGLLEVVQRDGFLVHWLTQIAPTVIDVRSLPQDVQKMIREFDSRGISLSLLDVTSLSLPSVTIVARSTSSENPQIIVSGASSTTFGQAIRDAMREMVLMSAFMFYKASAPDVIHGTPTPFLSDLNEKTRQLFWRGSERIKQFEWFLSGKRVSYEELCKKDLTQEKNESLQLKKCLEVLKERGSDYYPIVYFPEHPIQEELGFFIAQVYIPKAFPLYLLECQGTFDSDRLKEFAESRNVEKWELNPLPHMFS